MKSIYLGLALLFSCVVHAQSITGIVKDENGESLAGISISIRNSFIGTTTNAEGRFSLDNLKQGKYTIVANGVGYEATEKTITIVQESISVEFEMKKAFSSLKEITVTASRMPEIIDRTPASVQVVNAAEIRAQALVSPNISNILAQAVPALAFGTNTTSNTGQTLRGRTPLILVDGIPQNTPLRAGGREIRTIDPEVIERIEIVKGATAIYGNGADGGVINYITKKPRGTNRFEKYTYLSATGMPVHGSNTLGGRFAQQFSGRIKKFDYVASGTYERTGVYKDAEGNVLTPVYGLGESDIYNAFAKLGYNLSEKQRLELMYNYFGSSQKTDYIEQPGKYLETPTIGVRGQHSGSNEGTRFNHNGYLKYTAKDVFGHTSLDASAYLQSFYTVYGLTSFFQNGGQSTLRSDKKGFRLQANTPFKGSEKFSSDLTYGVDLMADKTSQKLTDGRIWVPDIKLFNVAPYVQGSATFFKDWIFKVGFRYDNINIDIPSFTQVKDAAGNGGNQINGGELSFNATTFNTGLRYARWEFFKPFVSYTQGFSIIDIGRYVRAAKENDIARMEIEPVVVRNFEAGFSSNLGWLNFSGSYFISKNKIGASLTEVNGAYVQQKAPEKTYGFETNLDIKPTDNLSLGVAYVYVEGKADINKNDHFDDSEDIYLNSTKISAPKTSAYVKWAPYKKLDLYVQWLHLGERKRFAPRSNGRYGYGEGPVEGVDLVNLSGSYQVAKNIQLSLGIENLFNKSYFTPLAQWSAQDADYSRANGIRFQLGIGIKW